MNEYKGLLLSILGLTGGFIATLLGGWDTALQTLIIFMTVDYISGVLVAGVFKKSKKSKSGTLSSGVGFKGIVKKVMGLVLVLIACRLDLLLGITFCRDSVIIALVSNEVLSIIENAGLMGVPVPEAIKKAIEMLNSKNKNKNNDEEDNKNE